MLNGKFYTGLTPKMLDKDTGSRNRLESHLFWPDDTKVESAHETRVRRRSSFNTDTPRDANLQRQTSWNGNESGATVDTRERFQKEFAKSSIQFFDNIQEEEVDNRQGFRKPTTRQTLKRDITIKPTAVKMQLPSNNTTQEEFEAIKKKSQAYSSKIQFYDYVDDKERPNSSNNNNKFKPKIDMNDKKTVERNTKNSPKLQVKGTVRNLRMVDEQRNNIDRNQEEDYERPRRPEARIIRNEVRGEQQRRNNARYESPNRGYSCNNDEQYQDQDYDYDRNPSQYVERRAAQPRAQSVPKRILKYTQPNGTEHDYEYYNDEVHNDLDYVERNTRNMRIRTSPKKHVTYGDEVYENRAQTKNDNERNARNDEDDDYINYREQRNDSRTSLRMSNGNGGIATTSYGSSNSINRHSTGNNQRQSVKRPNMQDFDDYNPNETENIDDEPQQMRYETNTASKKSFSTFNNNNNKKSNNNNNKRNSKLNNHATIIKPREQQNKIAPKVSPTSLETANTDSPTSPTSDAQKHLRSSLCFHDGEIVANTRGNTPTSEAGSRRTARSAATTRRICVGLPD